jgi:hypothetical protein
MIPIAPMKAFTTQIATRQKENGRQVMIETAKAEEARVIRQQTTRSGGIAPTLTRIVDGKRGGRYEDVKDNGVIILQWKYLREIAARAVQALKARAPVVSGEYKAGLKAFADYQEVGLSAGGIRPATQIVTVVATVPYSRRLEIGRKKGGAWFVDQVAPRMVFTTAEELKKAYSGVADVRFTYEDVAGPGGASARPSTGSRRADRIRDVALRYPSIRVVDRR